MSRRKIVPRAHWFVLPAKKSSVLMRHCKKCGKCLRLTAIDGERVWLSANDRTKSNLAPDHKYACVKAKVHPGRSEDESSRSGAQSFDH